MAGRRRVALLVLLLPTATACGRLQGSYELIVIGPASSFAPDTAVAIAKDVAARFAPTAAATT